MKVIDVNLPNFAGLTRTPSFPVEVRIGGKCPAGEDLDEFIAKVISSNLS